jgi:hypothetical protein
MLRSIRVGLSALALAALPAVSAMAAPDAPKAGGDFASPAATPRKAVEVPAGYQKVTVGVNTAICQPNDVKWVTDALTAVKAPEAPPGAPSARVAQLKDKRELLLKNLKEDLALADDAEAKALIDVQIPAKLATLEKTRPPVFYLVATEDKFQKLVQGGWGAGQFRFVPLTGKIEMSGQIPFTPEKEMDDTVMPALFDEAKADEATRVKGLTNLIQSVDANVMNTAAQQAAQTVIAQFFTFVQDKVVAPLKLKDDQKWFGVGLTNYLGVKYGALALGMNRAELLKSVVAEPEAFPVSMRSVNLLNPDEAKTMREEIRPYYTVAAQRKATLVIAVWTEQAGGDTGIAKVLSEVRAKPPADAWALLGVIKDASKVDLAGLFGGKPAATAPAAPVAPK